MPYELGMKAYVCDLLLTSPYVSHMGEGYNVLYADGHVRWHADPWRQVPKIMETAPEDNSLRVQQEIFEMFDNYDQR